MYAAESSGSPFGVGEVVEVRCPRGRRPPRSRGSRAAGKCVATGPMSSPPRVLRRSVRLAFAITALRTLMSSNGGIVRVERDVAVAAARGERSAGPARSSVAACLITLGGVGKSPLTSALPVRIFLPAETVSAKPSWIVISSRYAGRKSAVRRLPVRVADQVDLLVRRVARELALELFSIMYGPLDDLVLAVGRRVLGVVLLRVLLRNRGRDRQRQRADHAERRSCRRA